MQKLLNDNDVLVYSIYNEEKTDRFIRSLKDKIYKKLIVIGSESYLG